MNRKNYHFKKLFDIIATLKGFQTADNEIPESLSLKYTIDDGTETTITKDKCSINKSTLDITCSTTKSEDLIQDPKTVTVKVIDGSDASVFGSAELKVVKKSITVTFKQNTADEKTTTQVLTGKQFDIIKIN